MPIIPLQPGEAPHDVCRTDDDAPVPAVGRVVGHVVGMPEGHEATAVLWGPRAAAWQPGDPIPGEGVICEYTGELRAPLSPAEARLLEQPCVPRVIDEVSQICPIPLGTWTMEAGQ